MKTTTDVWDSTAESDAKTVFLAARSATPDDDAAWDCAQEAFLTAIRREDSENIDDPVRWLCGVARNHARNLARGRRRWWGFLKRLADRRPTGAAMDPDGDADGAADAERLSELLARLPGKQREAVVLRYLGEMTIAEVAQAQGVSESAAKARIHRGLSRLRRRLGGAALLLLLLHEARAGGSRVDTLLAATHGSFAGATLLVAASFLIGVAALFVTSGTSDVIGPPALPPVTLTAALPGPAPAPVPPVLQQSQPESKEARLILMDLADGRPLVGFRIRIGKEDLRSGPDGTVRVLPGMKNVDVIDNGWVAPGKRNRILGDGDRIWLARMITVRGRVLFPKGEVLAPDDVEIGWRLLGDLPAPGEDGRGTPPPPWTQSWVSLSRLFGRRTRVHPEPDGSFELDLPCVHGLIVFARSREWMPAWEAVKLPRGPSANAEVTLPIEKRAIRLHGTVENHRGEPIPNLVVHAAISLHMTPEEYRRGDLWPLGYSNAGVSATRARVGTCRSTTTGPGGEFEIYVYAEGEILILAYPPGGYGPIEHRITRRAGDSERVRLSLIWVGEGAKTTVLDRGRPVKAVRATLRDLSNRGCQVAIPIDIGPGGVMPTALLIPGRVYRVEVPGAGRPMMYLRWQPMKALELSTLSGRPPETPWKTDR